MKELSRFPFYDKRIPICLHDREITDIFPKDGGITITLSPCDDEWPYSDIDAIHISSCEWDDTMVYYKHSFAPFHIPLFLGVLCEPDIFKKLLAKNKTLSIIDEYFGNDFHLHIWVFPHRFRRAAELSVHFDTNADSEIICYNNTK